MCNIHLDSKLFQSLACAAGLLISATGAEAVDRKTLPGHACQPISNSAAFIVSGIALLNPSSGAGSNTFVCPFPRDIPIASPLPTQIIGGAVYVVDNHPSLAVTCSMRSYTKTGAVFAAPVIRSSSGAAAGAQLLSFAGMPGAVEGAYDFSCSIPPTTSDGKRSGIFTYSITENDDYHPN